MIIFVPFFFFFFLPLHVSASSNETISLFCTSNKDGTGSCFDESGQNQYECLIVPGAIAPCKNPDSGRTIWCVYIGDSQFTCMDKKESLRSEDVSPQSLDSNFDDIPESIFQGTRDIAPSSISDLVLNST